MLSPGAVVQWERVSQHESMEAGLAALHKFTDGGENPGCCWARVPGGDAHRIKFSCTQHDGCGVLVRLLATSSGIWLERARAVKHTGELNNYDRSNAALTREQKGSAREAVRYGGTASDIMKNHQLDELAKPDGKRKADDTGVEGATMTSFVLATPAHLTRLPAFMYLRAHSYLMWLHLHAFRDDRMHLAVTTL